VSRSSCSVSRSPFCATGPSTWASSLQHQAGFQRRQELSGHLRAIGESVPGASSRSRQNYNQASTGLNLSVSYRFGGTHSSAWHDYSLTKSSITAFSTASQTFFQTISFRLRHSGVEFARGHRQQLGFVQLYLQHSTTRCAPQRKELHGGLSGGRHRRKSSVLLPWWPTSASCRFTTDPLAYGTQHFGSARAVGLCAGLGGDVARQQPLYSGGEGRVCAASTFAGQALGYVPIASTFQLTNPDNSCVPRDPNNPQLISASKVAAPGLRNCSTAAIQT